MAEKLSIEEQVAIILRKAETATPEEAEMLSARAEYLMLKHGIDRSVAEAAADNSLEKDHIEWFSVTFDGVYAKAQVFMVHDIVMAYGDARGYVSSHDRPKKGMTYHFCSFSKDGEALKGLIESLMLQCTTATTEFIEEQDYAWTLKSASEKYNAKRSFILGFGRGAASRITETRKKVVAEAKSESTGTDLVLRNKSTEVEKAYDRMMGGNTRRTRGMQTTYSGYSAGRTAGRDANVGAGRKAVSR